MKHRQLSSFQILSKKVFGNSIPLLFFFPLAAFASIDSLTRRVDLLESQTVKQKDVPPFFLDFEALLFKVTENGLPYATANQNQTTTIVNGKIKNVVIPYQWGFRLGIGGKLPQDQWDLLLEWTHFHPDSNNSALAPLKGALFPTWINPFFSSGGYVDKARARWRLHLGIVDAEIGRNFKISKWFQFRSSFGLRSAWIRQKFLLDYFGGTFLLNGHDKLHMKNKFWGLGPLINFEMKLALNKNLSLIGNTGISLPYGIFYTHQSEDATVGKAERLETHSIFRKNGAINDLSLGIQWNLISRNSTQFYLSALWENHLYYAQNQLSLLLNPVESIASSNNGDLAIQGFSFAAKLDF